MLQSEYNFFTFVGSPVFKRTQVNLNSVYVLWIITNSELMNFKYVTFGHIILKVNLEKNWLKIQLTIAKPISNRYLFPG